MNRLATAIAIASTVFLAQGCSSTLNSQVTATQPATEASSVSPDRHNDHMAQTSGHDGHTHHDNHGTDAAKTPAITQAKLTVPTEITANQPVNLAIDIQDTAGKSVTEFDVFQEKLMHLIIVSDDLQFFSHLHPNYKENGQFEIEASFPQAGNYTLFADYKPQGETERVSILKTSVFGTKSPSSEPDLTRTKISDNTKVNLSFSNSENIKVGEEVTLRFDLQDAATNQAASDLQPYLGEMAHLVIVKQSPSLTETDYLHAHAMPSTSPGQVDFMTRFPEPGNYKMWVQFNRNGKIITSDFWVNVL